MKKGLMIFLFVMTISSPLMAKGQIQDGLCKVYSSDNGGFLLLIEMQRESVRDGAAIQFYDDGVVEKIGWYRQGVLHGVYQSFWRSGEPRTLLDYSDGILHGRANRYDQHGRPQFLLSYERGMLHGPGKYYEDGLLKRIVNYQDDQALVIDYEM